MLPEAGEPVCCLPVTLSCVLALPIACVAATRQTDRHVAEASLV